LAVDESAAAGVRPLVVKVGGSLAETGRMASVLATIVSAKIPVIIVPGGGPFADAIRALQPTMGYDDGTAHRLAMLAMRQMAEFMSAQQERLRIVETLEEMSVAFRQSQVPVWAPLRMISVDESIAANWDATSDSLAARLAELLDARLLLLKSVDVDKTESINTLAERSVVDSVLPSIVARGCLSWSIFGPSDDARLRAILNGEG
jgi:aspartokinase-like uncharacterized kinase